MCASGKKQHATRDAALIEMKRLVYDNHVRGDDARNAWLNVYPCDECNAWHIGHSQQTVPTIYHYDRLDVLDRMTDTVALQPSKPYRLSRAVRRYHTGPRLALYKTIEEPAPLVWFSWNAEWDFSGAPHPGPFVSKPVVPGEPLIRIGAWASIAKLRWSDYLERNRTSRLMRNETARLGKPADWLATDQPVSFTQVKSLEIWMNGAWQSVESVPAEQLDSLVGK